MEVRPPWSDRVACLLALGMGVYSAGYLVAYALRVGASGAPPFGDFFAFWSFARFVIERPAAGIYDVAALQDFQAALDPRFVEFYPYPYPPPFALLLAPLGLLPYGAAFAVWIAVTMAAWLAAVVPGVGGRLWVRARLVGAWVAPGTLFAVIAGQNGFLTGALLVGGMRLLPARPWLAGCLLAGLVYKPHFCLLAVPALLAARQFRAMAAAVLSVAALFVVSSAAFGVAMWRRWLEAVPALWSLFEVNREHLAPLMPTPMAGLLAAGLPGAAAQAVQAVLALAVAALVFWRYRRGVDAMAWTAPAAGALLATPYAFVYDMPAFTASVLAVWAAAVQSGRAWHRLERVGLLLGLLLPLLIVGGSTPALMLAPIAMGLVFGLALRTDPHAFRAPIQLNNP